MQRVFSVLGSRYEALFNAVLIKRLLARAVGALALSELLAYALPLPPLWRSLLSDVVGLLLFAFTLPPLFKPALETLTWLAGTTGHPNKKPSDNKPSQLEHTPSNELSQLAQHSRELTKQLEQAHRRFDTLFHNLADAAAHFDKHGLCFDVNEPRYFDMAFPLQQLLGKTLHDHYGDLARRHEYYRRRALELGEAQVYRHDLAIDGIAYYREYRMIPLGDTDLDRNNETIVLVRDISKEQNVTQQLEASEQRFRTFFKKSPTPCLLLDMESSSNTIRPNTTKPNTTKPKPDNTDAANTNLHDINVGDADDNALAYAGVRFQVLINDAFEQFLGYNPWTETYFNYDTAVQRYRSYSHAEEFQQEAVYINDILQGKRHSYQLEKRFYTHNGSLRWGDVHSNVIAHYDGSLYMIMFTLQDITEQKRTRQHLQTSLLQLQQSETRFRAFFEQNASPCTIIMPVAGTAANSNNTEPSETLLLYIMANDAFVAFLGDNPWAHGTHTYKEALAIHRHHTHPDDIALEQQYINEVFRGERDSYRIEKRYFHKDGSIRWGDTSQVTVRDQNGNVSLAFTVILDITKTKQAQGRLHTTLTQLQQSERKFRTFFEDSPTPCVIITRNNTATSNTTDILDIVSLENPEDSTDIDDLISLPLQVVTNKAFKAFVGRDEWSLEQVPFRRAYRAAKAASHPEDFIEEMTLISKVLRGECDSYRMEKRYLHTDGSLRWGDMQPNTPCL